MKNDFIIQNIVSAEDIKATRAKLKLTQREFARLVNVSNKTVENWESGKKDITGPISCLLKVLNNHMDIVKEFQVYDKVFPMRLWYMFHHEVVTIIDVDEVNRSVKVYNYTPDIFKRAFGKIEQPSYEEYEAFLETRCFPKERDNLKLVLSDLDLPFYEPIMIIKKTEGRMAEDDFWIKIER